MVPLVSRVQHVPGLLGLTEGWAWWVARTDPPWTPEPMVLQAGFEQSVEMAQAVSVQCRRGWEVALAS